MIVTPKFVFIHVPKTGGTFVQSALNKIYGSKFYQPISEDPFNELSKRLKLWEAPIAHQLIKHAPCNQIPSQYSDLPIISCIRNPFEWYVSNYKYGWWLSHPEDYPHLKSDPEWPDISFSRYLTLSGTTWLQSMFPNCQLEIGRLTALFIQYYCKNPNEVVSATSFSELFKNVKNDIYSITFFRTESLNTDLYNYLIDQDFQTSEIQFIKDARPLSPRGNRTKNDSTNVYFDEGLKASIYSKDKLLFDLFPLIDPAHSSNI
jgi:hypothetical protein